MGTLQVGDSFDAAVTFLKKRDGIDKILKVVRYTAKLLAADGDPKAPWYTQVKSLDKSLGTTRKALRLGKFLGNVQDVQTLARCNTASPLPYVAAVGEGVYYFLDQFIWLVKAGVLPPRLEARLAKWSAWCELVGYAASVTLRSVALRDVQRRLRAFGDAGMRLWPAASEDSVAASKTSSGDDDMHVAARRQLAELRAKRRLLLVLLTQDVADALIALQEVAGKVVTVASPRLIAICGLISAHASIWQNWPR